MTKAHNAPYQESFVSPPPFDVTAPMFGSSSDTFPDSDTQMSDANSAHVEATTNGTRGAHQARSDVTGANGGHQATHGTDGAHISGVANDAPGALEVLGRESRQLIQVIQKLDALSIEKTLPTLPKFVVVGDQSSGKSSIIEAICDIALPRSQGTCTRCPFQITTTSSKQANAPWSCKISLIHRYSYTPRMRDPNATYDRWMALESAEKTDFALLHDKEQLGAALIRAQLAILNPKENPAKYANLSVDVDDVTAVGFSPNIVSIEIAAPGLPELSFFDLPGAINVSADGEEHLVFFVEQLLKSYLSEEKALVLLACSANIDIDTSTAFRFVRECKAADRCMGVLTKPDLLDSSRHHMIGQVLHDELIGFSLGNGWYVTKQRSQKDLQDNISYAEARDKERKFFNSEPWSTVFADHATRFSTPQLQNAISERLTEHILRDLPEIQKRVDDKLSDVSDQLRQFPVKERSATHTVVQEVQELVKTIVDHLQGDGLENKFRTAYRKIITDTRSQLENVGPQVMLSTPGYVKPSFTIDSGDEDGEGSAPTPSKSRKGNNGQAVPVRTPQHRTPHPPARDTPASGRRAKPDSSNTTASKTVFKLDEIKLAIEKASSSGLLGEVNHKVKEHFALRSVCNFRTVAETVMKRIQSLFQGMLDDSIKNTLEMRRGKTQFFTSVTEETTNFLAALLRELTYFIKHALDCEMHKPTTYSLSILNQSKKAIGTKLDTDRLTERVNEHFDTAQANGMKVTNAQEREKKQADAAWVAMHLGPDDFRCAVEAMVLPLAYYGIAAARLLDTIALYIETDLFQGLEKNLLATLMTELRVSDEMHCQQLLAEDPGREKERRVLLVEQEKLKAAMNELRMLPRRGL